MPLTLALSETPEVGFFILLGVVALVFLAVIIGASKANID